MPGLALPVPAPASTREHVRSGDGVQQQCLPFPAATALGLTDRLRCLPAGRSPGGGTRLPTPLEAGLVPADERLYYVHDVPRCRFSGNAFALDAPPQG